MANKEKGKADTSRTRTQERKQAVIEALQESLGIVTTACINAGVSRSQFYEWLKNDKEFAKAVEDIEDVTLDFVEGKLLQNVKDNDTQSILFYLKTKGKRRGYTERTEIQADITSGGKAFTGFSSVLPHYPNIEQAVAEQEQNRPTEE
jgi:hypothetical protein